MKRFSYRYESRISFSSPVSVHSWHLRCLPREEQFQRSGLRAGLPAQTAGQLRIEAEDPTGRAFGAAVSNGRDAFGNAVQYGCIIPAHTGLRIVAEGIVMQTPYRICGTVHGMYAAPSAFTQLDAGLKGLLSGVSTLGSPTETARRLSSAVHRHMSYAPGSTGVQTSAAQAFAQAQGVCQDYAHILIALLRASGIPARYVCGYLSGAGATHAWVEYFDSGVWYALDPTHDRAVDYGCIKIAHGRDSADCAVNRGIFTGNTLQQNSISIKVEEL